MHIKPYQRIFGFLVVTMMLNACTTMRPIEPTPTEVKQHFKIGDTIKVYTTDGTAITFEVVDITEEAVIGTRETIPFTDIVKVEKKTISVEKTAAAGGTVALSAVGTFIILLIIAIFTSGGLP